MGGELVWWFSDGLKHRRTVFDSQTTHHFIWGRGSIAKAAALHAVLCRLKSCRLHHFIMRQDPSVRIILTAMQWGRLGTNKFAWCKFNNIFGSSWRGRQFFVNWECESPWTNVLLQGGGIESCESHNLVKVGAIPAPVTILFTRRL